MSDPNHAPSPRTVVDTTTGRPILMAPKRQGRPMHTGSKKSAARCPFCAGHEQDTPPQLDREPAEISLPPAPSWRARAFANKYPATDWHDVIAEGAGHAEHPCDLSLDEMRAAVQVWQRRVAAIERAPGVATAFLFKNVGARAGASIAHNHSQVIGLDRLPPRLELEREQQRLAKSCLICAARGRAEQGEHVIFRNDAFCIFAPDPPKLPFESWLVPVACPGASAGQDFLTCDPTELADALCAWFAGLHAALDRPPLNLWLHRIPATQLAAGETFHWHFELQPRTGQLAGLELGGDMYINSVSAAETAQRLRHAAGGRRRD
ncbi:MAG: DUF4931 domain-containing protein [Planctomycetota bacterium]